LRAALADASRLSASFAGNLTGAFTDATLKGRELSDVVRQLALNLSQNTLEAALAPISKTFGDALSGLVTSAGLGSALPVPFAKGGVISSPVTFPLGQGAPPGLAGEAGPEAVLPLARGADGRLFSARFRLFWVAWGLRPSAPRWTMLPRRARVSRGAARRAGRPSPRSGAVHGRCHRVASMMRAVGQI